LGRGMPISKDHRETRSAIKKSFILEKAGLLFWQKGYHHTNMKDIADACGCRPANMYHYFRSKEDILYEVIRDITERTVASVRHLEYDDTTDPVTQIKSLIKGHYGLLMKMDKSNLLLPDTGLRDLTPEHQKDIIDLRDVYDNILRKVLRRGIDSGVFANIDERITGYFISSMIVRSNIWFSPSGRLSADEVTDMMFNLIYRGIRISTNKPASRGPDFGV
jgi:AcrR family transcriptional regulator